LIDRNVGSGANATCRHEHQQLHDHDQPSTSSHPIYGPDADFELILENTKLELGYSSSMVSLLATARLGR
jgi:hypothetical protein